jgi:Flp pilus assembly protein TadG
MLRRRQSRRGTARAGSEDGVQIVELALVLPLLMVLVVGIFDFGAAFNLKQKLTNVAREAARFGANQPTSDLTNGTPASVTAIRDLVDSYLTSAKINDCGLAATPSAAGTLTWQATGSGSGCPGTLTVTISRGALLPATGTGVPGSLNIVCTQVTISYPYQWQFNRVIKLLVSGSAQGPSQIAAAATVPNMD